MNDEISHENRWCRKVRGNGSKLTGLQTNA